MSNLPPPSSDSNPAGEPASEASSHPLASRIQRAILAHPVLRDQQKLKVGVEDGIPAVRGKVFTIDMYNQLVGLIERVAGEERVIFEVESEIQPPQARSLQGQVPSVSRGAGATKASFSVRHLLRRR